MVSRLACAVLLFTLAVAQTPPPVAKPAEKPPSDVKTDTKQDPKPDTQQPTFRTTGTLVNVPFTVVDLKDRLVTDLKQENFQIYEDGQPMPVRFFTSVTKVPLRIGLLVDTSNSVRLYFKQEQDAAVDFIFTLLEGNRKNRMFLMTFDFVKEFLTPFSDDADHLASLVRKLKPGGGTSLNDAIIKACQEKLQHEVEEGGLRRVIVLITDGDDDASKNSISQAIDAARRANVTIYAIATIPYGYDNPDGEKALVQLTEATGGKVVYPWKKPPSADYGTGYLSKTQIDGSNSVYGVGTGQYSSETSENLSLALSMIQRELQLQYNIAYIPSNSNPDNKYRHIKLVVNVDGLKVRARPGYFYPFFE